MAEEPIHMSIVVAGDVHSGKSSLVGRLLYDMGDVDERTMEQVKKEAEELGKPACAFAHIFDNTKDEQEREHTISCKLKEFYTKRYHYTVIDTPGHRDYVKNFISGASQADTALLLCSADGSGDPRYHARLLRLFGIDQLVVCINKMDSLKPPYSEECYDRFVNNIKKMLVEEGWGRQRVERGGIPIIPMSGLHSQNILSMSEKMPWWKGVTVTSGGGKRSTMSFQVGCLLDALDEVFCPLLRRRDDKDDSLSAPVAKVITIIKGTECVVTTHVKAGTVAIGEDVVFLPTHTASKSCTGRVQSIEMHHKDRPTAVPGDNVGISLSGLSKANIPRNGDVMVTKATLKCCSSLLVEVSVIQHPSKIKVGFSLECCVSTSNLASSCRLDEIYWKIGRSTNRQKHEHPMFVAEGDICQLVFKLTRPFVPYEEPKTVVIFDGSVICMIGNVQRWS